MFFYFFKKLTSILGLFLVIQLMPLQKSIFAESSPNQETLLNSFKKSSFYSWVDSVKNKIKRYDLDNGFSVIFYPTAPENQTPEVVVMLAFDVGSRDEKTGQYGYAHAVEHMIFKGTDSMSERDLDAIAEKFCLSQGDYNANTRIDTTRYYFKTDKKNWPVFCGILADCMQNVRFDEHHFASEVKAIINELKMRNQRPHTKIYDTLGSVLFPSNHPYHHNIGGFKEDLLTSSAAQLKDFYKEHYTPNNGLLVIVGDVNEQELITALNRYFVPIPKSSNASKKPQFMVTHQTQELEKKDITFYKHIRNPLISLCWQTPGEDNCMHVCGDVIDYCLSKRLERILQDELDIVLSVEASHLSALLGGTFHVSFEPKASAEKLKAVQKKCKCIILEQLHDIALHGPKEAELFCFKNSYHARFLSTFERCSSIANFFASSFFQQRNQFREFDYLTIIDTLTAQDIQHFCSTYLNKNQMHKITCRPIKEEKIQSWLTLQESIDAVDEELMNERIRESALDEVSKMNNLPEPQLIDFTFEKPDQEFILSNGLQVFVKNRKGSPFTALSCNFKNKPALALYLASTNQAMLEPLAINLLLEGSVGFSKQDHQEFFDGKGARVWPKGLVCLGEDFTSVANRWLRILTNPTYPQEAFDQYRINAIEAILANAQQCSYVAETKGDDYLFKDYWWRKSDAETIEYLHNLSRNTLVEFHQKFISPNMMFLTLVGSINPQTIQNELETVFGSWHPQQEQPTIALQSIPDITNPPAAMLSEFLPEEQVTLNLTRLADYPDSDDNLALGILLRYINKKLYEVRELTGLFYGCHAYAANSCRYLKSSITISTTVTPYNAQQAEFAIRKVLADIAKNGMIPERLFTFKQAILMGLAKSFATNQELAATYARLFSSKRPWSYYDDYLARIQAITIEQINEVARRYCNPDTWTCIVVGRVEKTNA
jgi:zinc protease